MVTAAETSNTSRRPLIDIASSERVLIVGTSGSGKSWLTRNVLLPRYAVRPVVFDPKERWESPRARIVHSYNPRIPYQVIRLPEYDERDGPGLWDAQAQRVLRGAPHTIIVDELNLVANARTFPPSLARIIRTGRDTKAGPVGMWMLTQQPSFIPTSAFSQSGHKFIFMLEREDDIQRVGRETCKEIANYLPRLRKYDYVYYNKERGLLIPVWHRRRGNE